MEDGWDMDDDDLVAEFDDFGHDPGTTNGARPVSPLGFLGGSLLDDSDDDDSFIPDSLRDFLQAADKKLERDLAGFLSPEKDSGDAGRENECERDDWLETEAEEDRLLRSKQKQREEEEERERRRQQSQREAREKEALLLREKEEEDRRLMLRREQQERELREAREREALALRVKEEEEQRRREEEEEQRRLLELQQQQERERQQKLQEEEEQRQREEEEQRRLLELQQQQEQERQQKLQEEEEQRRREEEEQRRLLELQQQQERERQQKLREEEEQQRREEEEEQRRLLELQQQQERERQLQLQEEEEQRRREEEEQRRLLELQQQQERERQQKLQEEKEQGRREEEEQRRLLELQQQQEWERQQKEEEERKMLLLKEQQEQESARQAKLLEEQQRRKRQEELEAARQEQKRLAAIVAAEEEEEEEESDRSSSHDALLDIIHPSANVTESHLKRIAMEGSDYYDGNNDDNEAVDLLPLIGNTINTPFLSVPSPIVDESTAVAAANANTDASGEENTFSSSPATAKVGRKLQMELDREAHRASLDGKEANQNQESLTEKRQRLKELQSTSFERHRRLEELEEEEAAAATAAQRKNSETGRGSMGTGDTNEIGDGGETNEKTALQHKTNTPSNAAAAAANQAAAVVAVNDHDEGPLAIPDAIRVGATDKQEDEEAEKLLLSLMGPVERAVGTRNQKQTEQNRDFQGRDPMSPPRPKEIITNNAFFEDGGPQSVSPLGREGGIAIFHQRLGAVSPLASPRMPRKPQGRDESTKRRPPGPLANRGSGEKAQQSDHPASARRRPVTRTNSAFNHVSRPTSASNAGRIGLAAQQKAQPQRSKINPEEEQRKARERIRKRMGLQRKKAAAAAAASNGLAAASKHNSSSAERAKKTNDRRERMLRLEEERKAKIKAKLEAKEEARLRTLKKREEEKKQQQQRLRHRRTPSQLEQSQEEKTNGTEIKIQRSAGKAALTIPRSPRFATDRRMGVPTNSKPLSKEKATEDRSLASSSDYFGKGLRSSVPMPSRSSATPVPRRLTIPKAPNFATSRRHGDKTKSTPFSSPNKKKRDMTDDMSWSSTLRDVSGISPVSKTASSVKTGHLTIPITPQFQPIRKRPLPKSTSEKEMEVMQYYKDHPFKAREINMHASSSSAAKKLASPRRPLTKPESFHFHSKPSSHRPVKEDGEKKELFKPFKALPMPKFSSRKVPLGGTKTPGSSRPLTTPEPFKLHKSTAIHKSGNEKHPEADKEAKSGTFKALPMPDFSASKGSKKLKSPPSRPLTTPEPFRFHKTSSKRSNEKAKEEKQSAGFKARSMPKFAARNATPSTGTHPKAPGALTKSEKKRTKSTRSKTIPTGASGLLFHRSTSATNRLSRPKVVQETKQPQSKPFKAKAMPNFIPDVIVTRTPVDEEKRQPSRSPELYADEKYNSAYHHCDNSTISSCFNKASSGPKSLTEEPPVFVREEHPTNVTSTDSVKESAEPALPREDPVEPAVLNTVQAMEPPSEPPAVVRQRDPNPSPVASPQLNKSTLSMEDAKARLRERLSKRKSNASKPQQHNGGAAASSASMAFSTLQVQSRLTVQAEKNVKLEEKLRKMTLKKTQERSSGNGASYLVNDNPTPVKSNNTAPKSARLQGTVAGDSDDKCTIPEQHEVQQPAGDVTDDNTTSSILQLAQEVQRAAEDELSFYGSLDTRDRLERELGL